MYNFWERDSITTAEGAYLANMAYQKSPNIANQESHRDQFVWEKLKLEGDDTESGTNVCIWAVYRQGYGKAHVFFVTQGTHKPEDWPNDNWSAFLCKPDSAHFKTAKGLVSTYLDRNKEDVQRVSFAGHSMGGRLSDLLAANIYDTNEHVTVKQVRMYDSPGTKVAIETLFQSDKEKVEGYLNRVDREEVVGTPNLVNMCGEHLSSVKFLREYGEFDAPLQSTIKEAAYGENVIKKHKMETISEALQSGNAMMSVEQWGLASFVSQTQTLGVEKMITNTLGAYAANVASALSTAGMVAAAKHCGLQNGQRFVDLAGQRISTAAKQEVNKLQMVAQEAEKRYRSARWEESRQRLCRYLVVGIGMLSSAVMYLINTTPGASNDMLSSEALETTAMLVNTSYDSNVSVPDQSLANSL